MDDEDIIEREVRHCREELKRRTSGLIQARQNAENSIRKYRDEVEKILQRSYGNRVSQGRGDGSSSRQILADVRSRRSTFDGLSSYSSSGFRNMISFGDFAQTLACGMFLGLILIYLRLKFPELQRLIWPRGSVDCDPSRPPGSRPCKDTLQAINALFAELSRRTGSVVCDRKPAHEKLMSRIELESFVLSKRLLAHHTLQSRVRELLSLILTNPQWNISALDVNKTVLTVTSPQQAANVSAEVAFIFTDLATKSILCRLEIAFWKLATHAAIGLSGVVLLFSLLYGLKSYKDSQEAFNRECFDMVDRITDLLISQKQEHLRNSKTVLPYLALSHIHDTLIPLSKRGRLERVWEKAREIIGKWESRVRQETQLIDGEEYVVWRWLGPLPGSRPNSDVEDSMI